MKKIGKYHFLGYCWIIGAIIFVIYYNNQTNNVFLLGIFIYTVVCIGLSCFTDWADWEIKNNIRKPKRKGEY